MKSVIQPLAESVLISLGLSAAASAADAGIHKTILDFGHNTTLIILNDEIQDIIKIVQALGDSRLLSKGVSKTIQNEVKEQKRGFFSMLLGTLGASLLGNMLAGTGIVRVGYGSKVKGIVRAGYGSKQCKKEKGFLFKDFCYYPIV